MNAKPSDREALLAKAKAADDMAAQFPHDAFLRLSWTLIAESYRDLVKDMDKGRPASSPVFEGSGQSLSGDCK